MCDNIQSICLELKKLLIHFHGWTKTLKNSQGLQRFNVLALYQAIEITYHLPSRVPSNQTNVVDFQRAIQESSKFIFTTPSGYHL